MIIVEQNFHDVISEQDVNSKKLYLKGVFMEASVRNRNGRIYDVADISRAVDIANQAAAEGRYVLGELDHPVGRLEVHAQNVSHKIIEMSMRGNQAIGKAEILTELPMGKIAEGLIKSGVNLGVSSRGAGTVDHDGHVRSFKFKTVDIVVEPSAHNAYPESVMESLQKYNKSGHIIDLSEAVVHDRNAQKYFQKEIAKFLETIFDR